MKLDPLIASALLVLAGASAHALELKPYSVATLAEAQKADTPVAGNAKPRPHLSLITLIAPELWATKD